MPVLRSYHDSWVALLSRCSHVSRGPLFQVDVDVIVSVSFTTVSCLLFSFYSLSFPLNQAHHRLLERPVRIERRAVKRGDLLLCVLMRTHRIYIKQETNNFLIKNKTLEEKDTHILLIITPLIQVFIFPQVLNVTSRLPNERK